LAAGSRRYKAAQKYSLVAQSLKGGLAVEPAIEAQVAEANPTGFALATAIS